MLNNESALEEETYGNRFIRYIMNERSGARGRSEECGVSELVTQRASRRANGLVHTCMQSNIQLESITMLIGGISKGLFKRCKDNANFRRRFSAVMNISS